MIVNGRKVTGYESVRLSDPSLTTISDSIGENHKAYVNFVSSLKSPITTKAYVIRLKNYLRSPSISFSTLDELLGRDLCTIEQGIIELLIDMRHRKELSYSAQNVFLSALTHFFSINDVIVNRKKIKKFMSESENKYEYRSYTIEEISRLLEISDEREKAIILLLASTGMRVGAVHPLLLKDLKKWVLHHCHSFRIFAITQMQRAKIDKTIREMLVGHSTGLDSVYFKPSEEEIFEEYKKTFDYLTISNNFRGISSQKEKQLRDNDIELLTEKYEQDINNLKDDMNDKFTKILSLIQQNPNLVNIKPEVLEKIVK